jgi:hypothetical protein
MIREGVEVRAYGKTLAGQEDCMKDWSLSLQPVKRAQVGNISRVNISYKQRGLNNKKIDNMQNYCGVLIRRISDTKKETDYHGSLFMFL